MPSYKGSLTQQEQLLSRFVVNSPFRDDPDPLVIDRAAIVTCEICYKRFLNSDWLDQHLADGHVDDDPSLDLELTLSRADGMPLSPFQLVAKDLLKRIKSGELKPGSHIALKEVARRYGHTCETVNKAVKVLVAHGVISQAGYGRYTTWTIAANDESQDES